MAMTPDDVLKLIKDKEVKFIDLRFTDTRGKEQHVTVPVKHFTKEKFELGHAFDGSSIAGWKGIQSSDMLLMPDAVSARMDPFTDEPVLNITCDVYEPMDGKPYDRDPRSIAKRAEAYLKSTGLGEVAYFGPEPEFFIFDGVTWNVHMSDCFVKIKSEAAPRSSGIHHAPGNGYSGLSDFAVYYSGGIIKHANALNAITNPGTNSYKRLVPGFEAPINLAYSARNRSAACRIPYVSSPNGRRVEVRFPDPTTNSYLAFAAMLLAGLDGVQNKIHPGDPIDKNMYDLPPEEAAKVPHVCASLEQALDCLRDDHAFLTKGGVFSDDFLESYITLKEEELTRFRMTTHPVEFDMYYSS